MKNVTLGYRNYLIRCVRRGKRKEFLVWPSYARGRCFMVISLEDAYSEIEKRIRNSLLPNK